MLTLLTRHFRSGNLAFAFGLVHASAIAGDIITSTFSPHIAGMIGILYTLIISLFTGVAVLALAVVIRKRTCTLSTTKQVKTYMPIFDVDTDTTLDRTLDLPAILDSNSGESGKEEGVQSPLMLTWPLFVAVFMVYGTYMGFAHVGTKVLAGTLYEGDREDGK